MIRMTIIVTQKDYVCIQIGFAREHTECRGVLGTVSRKLFGVFIQVRIAVEESQGTRVIVRSRGRYIFQF